VTNRTVLDIRKNRGTTDGIYTMKRVQQITDRKQQPLFLLFVDLTAAFDHIQLFKSIEIRFPDDMYPRLLPSSINCIHTQRLRIMKQKQPLKQRLEFVKVDQRVHSSSICISIL